MSIASVARPGLSPTLPPPDPREARLRAAAQQLEGAFLAEMLKAAGLGKPREGLGGGGAGEAQFASFLAELQARQVAARGGLGLAESLFHALLGRGGADG